MKYFDIVDKSDEVIGKKTAQECHADPNLIHRVVHFTLVDVKNKKVLITQRSFDVKFDSGKWCFMGEHVLSGKEHSETVARGVLDELGVKVGAFQEAAHNIFSYDTQTEFVRFYLVDWNGDELHPDKSEIINTNWITIDELKDNKSIYSKMTEYWIDVVDWDKAFE